MTYLPSPRDVPIHKLFLVVILTALALTASSLGHAQTWKDREFRECPDCPVMVGIPAGTFLMGSPKDEPGRFDSEGPQHAVSIKAFALGKYDITSAQFLAFLKTTGYRPIPATEFSAWDGVRPAAVWKCSRQTGRPSASAGVTPRPISHGLMPRRTSYVQHLSPAMDLTVCRAKRNGNMPLGPGPRRPGGGAKRSGPTGQTATAVAAHGIIDCWPPSTASPPIPSASTACWETPGNGP